MSRLILLPVFCSLLYPDTSSGQFIERFSDGNFTLNPTWTGTSEQWTIIPNGDDYSLRSDGEVKQDTIYLSTPSNIAYGTWKFEFEHRNTNLSTANGIRIYLMADSDSLRDSTTGYYLQLGTNNNDEIKLYRQSGPANDNRIELGRSSRLLDGDDGHYHLHVVRTPDNLWTVSLNDQIAFQVRDETLHESRFFGIWVKHSTQTGKNFFFDNFEVTDKFEIIDSNPPELLNAYATNSRSIKVTFSEPVYACDPSLFEISPEIGSPILMGDCTPGSASAQYTLITGSIFSSGTVYLLTVHNIEDQAGNVTSMASTAFTFASSGTATDGLIINEIVYDWPDNALEFIELFNASPRAFDLSGIMISDNRYKPVPVGTHSHLIEPGNYIVLVNSNSTFSSFFPDHAAHQVNSWPTLNNSGDTVVLYNEGIPIDSVKFNPTWGGSSVSLERRCPPCPSNIAANWGSSLHPDGATPCARNSIFASDSEAPELLLAEQVTEHRIEVFFDEAINHLAVTPDYFRFVDQIPNSVAFTSDSTAILEFIEVIPDGDLSVTRIPDLFGNVVSATIPLTRLPRPGEVILNEIMYEPLTNENDNLPNQTEYIEVLSKARSTLTMRGSFWTGVPDESGSCDTLRFGKPASILPSGGYVVVFAEPEEIDNYRLHANIVKAFPETDFRDESILLCPLKRSTLGFRNTGDSIRLFSADGKLLDEVHYLPDWHNPFLIHPVGISLERIDPDGPTNNPSNWGSCPDPSGGTPGQQNDLYFAPETLHPENHLSVEPQVFSPDFDGRNDVATIRYDLNVNATTIRIRIFDSTGRLIRILESSAAGGHQGQVIWDGLDDGERESRIGIYIIHLQAVNAEQGSVEEYRCPVVLARPIR